MPVLRFAGCLAGFFVPVCVAGAVLCLCACFYGLAGAGCLLCVVSLCALVCGCLRLSVCLWCLRCACGALWVSVWQVLRCVVLWVSAGAALWSALMRCAVVAGCAFFNKNKGLQRFFNEIDYMRLYLPINYSIISIMCPALFDYLDNIMSIISVLFNFKKTPPSKSFGFSFFSAV